MKQSKARTIDISAYAPKVLIVGNGLIRSKGFSWEKLIENLAVKQGKDIQKYKRDDNFQVPNTVLAFITSSVEDRQRREQYVKELKAVQYQSNEKLHKLASADWDAILTTNYTYEIEHELDPRFTSSGDAAKRDRYGCTTTGKSVKDINLIQTYYHVRNNDVWHIHGESRLKSSIVLTQDEYARLIKCVVEYATNRGKDYLSDSGQVDFISWIDYFLLGELHIIGYGYNFEEFDMWWLLNRKKRELANAGRIHFYEPDTADNKYKLLAMRDIGIEVNTMGMVITNEMSDEEKGKEYDDFYVKAIEDIINQRNMGRM